MLFGLKPNEPKCQSVTWLDFKY